MDLIDILNENLNQVNELVNIKRGSDEYTVPITPKLGIDKEYTFINIPLVFTKPKSGQVNPLRPIGRNVYNAGGELNKSSIQNKTIGYYLKGNSPSAKEAGLIRNKQLIALTLDAYNNLDNKDKHPFTQLLSDEFLNSDNKVDDLYKLNPKIQDLKILSWVSIIKNLIGRDKFNELNPYGTADGRPDEPGNDELLYTTFELGDTSVNLNQHGIYLWVFNGTQVKYVGLAGGNNNLSGRVDFYSKIGTSACTTLGPNCRVNNAILQAQMMLGPNKNPNDYIKWFVLPLGKMDKNELESLESKLIKYFGTFPGEKDPFLDANNYRTLEDFKKIQQRGGDKNTPDRQTKQGFRGMLNRK